MTEKCLFSAPFSFMPDVQADYRSLLPTDFREVWHRGDLEPDSALTMWVVNPGQRFIIDDGVLDLYPNLRVLVTPSTGTNHIDTNACMERGITVCSLLDDREALNSISASAEFAFLLALNSLRRLDIGMHEVTERRWRQREDLMRGRELADKKVGLVGFGRIGNRLARYFSAFGSEVAYFDPYVEGVGYQAWTLEELFDRCDVVCICCTLSPETTGMIGKSLLLRLKKGACLINTSRGEVINEPELAEILEMRPDLRVGLDVLAGEVTNTHISSPLLDMHDRGQVVITPHIAGATVESQSKAAVIALELLTRHSN